MNGGTFQTTGGSVCNVQSTLLKEIVVYASDFSLLKLSLLKTIDCTVGFTKLPQLKDSSIIATCCNST